MAVSKVILNGSTLMDVTVDTVTSEKLLSGYQATGRDGQKIQGSYVPAGVSLTAGSTDPSEDAQHITPPSGYDGFSYFDVGAINSNYVGSNVAQRSGSDLSASGSIITVPSGYYSSEATKAVSAGSATTPTKTISVTPSISINTSTGMITATAAGSSSISPTVSAGYITTGTAGTVSVTGSNTSALSTQGATTINPTESEQIAVEQGRFTTGTVKVAAISSDYVGSAIAQRSSGDLSFNNGTFVAPSGYYGSEGIKNIQVAANAPRPSISLNQNTGIVTATATVISAWYNANSSSDTLQLSTQAATTITPTESTQTAVAANKYTTGNVTVAAIPSDYIGSAIASVDVVEGTTTVSGSTATRGIATWSAGVIPSGQMNAATFANSSTAQTQYVDISETTDAPVLVSGGYLYINKGYTDDLKISLAKLVPDGASADLASDKILSGYAAYDNDGNLVAGNIPSKSSANVSIAGPTVSIPSGYYANEVDTTVDIGSVIIDNFQTTPTPTISLNSATGVITVDTPAISTRLGTHTFVGGYVNSVQKGLITINSAQVTSQLSTQSATTVIPTESSQIAVASDKYTLGDVTVAAISSNYIGSAITQNSAADITVSGPTVSIPSGYYASNVSANVEIVAQAIPTILVTNAGQIRVTATQSAGYVVAGSASSTLNLVTQDTITVNPTESVQTAVAAYKFTTGPIKVAAIPSDYIGSSVATHSAADVIVSGPTISIPSGYYASAVDKTIATGSLQSAVSIPLIPNFSIDSNGIITVQQNTTTQISPILSAGYISSGQIQISIASSSTYALPTQASKIIVPSELSQIAVESGKFTLGDITVAAISSDYVGSNIAQRSSADVTFNNGSFTAPSGYYASKAYKNIAVAGDVTWPVIDFNTNTGVVTATAAVSSAWYNASSSSKTYALSTKTAATYTPSSATQSIPSGVYLTGVQTIAGDSNLIPENIIAGVSIFGVEGSGAAYDTMNASEIWAAAVSGWGAVTTEYEAYVWEAVTAGWGTSTTMSDEQIGVAVTHGWR